MSEPKTHPSMAAALLEAHPEFKSVAVLTTNGITVSADVAGEDQFVPALAGFFNMQVERAQLLVRLAQIDAAMNPTPVVDAAEHTES